MAIKIEFLAGQTEKKASPLYQWDYGQTLEIESLDLPPLIEVHFACPNMKEAIVHPCSVSNGVASVTIPNRCLEQADTITAWVYEINGTTGCTTKTILIPVVARTRPGRNEEIPQDVSDKYTELITEVNEAVGSITSGDLMVGRAAHATSADRAAEAHMAHTTPYAESAAFATGAGVANSATNATNDALGNRIDTTYVSFKNEFVRYDRGSMLMGGFYQFQVIGDNKMYYAILPSDSQNNCAMLGIDDLGLSWYQIVVNNGVVTVESRNFESSSTSTMNYPIYYRKIH